MKTKTLEQSIRESAHVNRGIILPSGQRTSRNWPLCLTCLREVDACELKDVSSKGCEILAKCHGAEDYYKVKWDMPMRDASANPLDDKNVGWAIKRAMNDFCPFDPKHNFDFSSKRT